MLHWLGRWLLRHAGEEFERIEARLDQIELALTDDRLTVLDTAERVISALNQRERKRKPAQEPPLQSESRFLGAARRFGKEP